MRAVHLAVRLTAYYLGVAAIVFAALAIFPALQSYMPVGGAEALLSGVSNDPFSAIEIGAHGVETLQGTLLWLVIAVTGAILTVLPLSWTYMAIRAGEDYDQSLVETIVILPIAVTSIVIIVNQSIALAFGLAGIVGGVRFRNTLKSSGDALYILTAIGVGLSAGIGALEIAIIMTVAFNYCFLLLWISDYGAKKGSRRYMRRAFKQENGDAPPEIVETPPAEEALPTSPGAPA